MPERVDLDRLRALHVRLAAYLTRADVLEMVSAVPALLDAAEERDRLRRDNERLQADLWHMVFMWQGASETLSERTHQCDALRAQLDVVEQLLNDWRYRVGIGGWRRPVSDSSYIVLARIVELENALAPKAPTTPTEDRLATCCNKPLSECFGHNETKEEPHE